VIARDRATGADDVKDMGKVMRRVMPQVKGRADGKRGRDGWSGERLGS
jgi:uncharacterized protein YqeY